MVMLVYCLNVFKRCIIVCRIALIVWRHCFNDCNQIQVKNCRNTREPRNITANTKRLSKIKNVYNIYDFYKENTAVEQGDEIK